MPARLDSSIEAMSLDECGESSSVYVGTTGGEVYASGDSGDHWSLIVSGLAPITKYGHGRDSVMA